MHSDAAPSTIADSLKASVEARIPEAIVEVTSSGGGHYSLVVRSAVFRDRSKLECHRLVYAAIAPFMSGREPPVHAIDTLTTIVS